MSRQKSPSNLHRSIGQLLIMGFDGTEMSPRLAALLTRMQPAGVILFARNITGGEQTYKLLKDCQACVSTPLFTAVDMEGGRVDRFRNVIGRSPSAADVFATHDRELFRQHGKVIGEACRTLGFNTDFQPNIFPAWAKPTSIRTRNSPRSTSPGRRSGQKICIRTARCAVSCPWS